MGRLEQGGRGIRLGSGAVRRCSSSSGPTGGRGHVMLWFIPNNNQCRPNRLLLREQFGSLFCVTPVLHDGWHRGGGEEEATSEERERAK